VCGQYHESVFANYHLSISLFCLKPFEVEVHFSWMSQSWFGWRQLFFLIFNQFLSTCTFSERVSAWQNWIIFVCILKDTVFQLFLHFQIFKLSIYKVKYKLLISWFAKKRRYLTTSVTTILATYGVYNRLVITIW
jgi:hypothetical protein